MDTFYRALVEAIEGNKPAAVATVVRTIGSSPREAGSKMLVFPDGSIVGSVGGGEMESRVIEAARQVIEEGKPRYLDMRLSDEQRGDPLICGGEMEIFVEPLLGAPTLLIVGAGHIGAACAELGKFLGFHVVVIDDRTEMLSGDRIPDADEFRSGDTAEELGRFNITPQTYVVLVTRAHTMDAAVLRAVVNRPAAYIGMLGSKRRVLTVYQTLKQEGIPEEAFHRVHAPIGLPIGAQTPQEIALSIMAEILQSKSRNGSSSS